MTYNLQNRQNRNTYEYLTLQITFYPTSGSTRYYSSTLFIVDNERGKKYVIFIYQFCVCINGVLVPEGNIVTVEGGIMHKPKASALPYPPVMYAKLVYIVPSVTHLKPLCIV